MRPEILVTGSGGLIGNALKRICPDALFITRKDYDLTDSARVESLFETVRPKHVIHLAAESGGVKINSMKNAYFFSSNIRINTNVLSLAQKYGVCRLVSVLSGCAFQFYSDHPSAEEDLHVGLPYDGNLGFGYAKRALDIQARLLRQQYGSEFTSLTPVTVYGANDNWDLEEGHVIGSLIHKCFLAKQQNTSLEVWGKGNAMRQFIYVEDVARLLLETLNSDYTGPETTIVVPDSGTTIRELADLIAQAMDFKGPIVFDATKPEGQLIKTMRSSRFSRFFPNFSFTSLEEGLKKTIDWFYDSQQFLRGKQATVIPAKAGIQKYGSPTLSEKNVKFFPKSAPRMGASVKTFGDDKKRQIASPDQSSGTGRQSGRPPLDQPATMSGTLSRNDSASGERS